jgi:hypothetical protein
MVKKSFKNKSKLCQKVVKKLSKCCQKVATSCQIIVKKLLKSCQKVVKKLSKDCKKVVKKSYKKVVIKLTNLVKNLPNGDKIVMTMKNTRFPYSIWAEKLG